MNRQSILNRARKELYRRKRNTTKSDPFMQFIYGDEEVPGGFKGIVVRLTHKDKDGVECKK